MASEMTPDTAPEPVERTAWQRWVGFWFPASDPTTLGFVRVCTGLLVFYIHLAYSVDLQQFFGKTGWYAHRFVERERHEYPWRATPFFDWSPESIVPATVPDFPHRRKAVIDFIRALPPETARRNAALQYLDRVAKTDNLVYVKASLDWFQLMGLDEAEQNRHLAALVAGRRTATTPDATSYYLGRTPAHMLDLPPDERQRITGEVRAFMTALPKEPTAREYVLNHLTELAPELRRAFVRFLLALPEDAAARDKKIDYLEYWNNEPEKSVRNGHVIFSVWFHVTDPTQMALIHAAILVAMLLFTVGLFTRVTSVLVWVAVVGYIHRTQQILFGMDTMMNILLFYLMIGNSGAALSVDRLVARYRAARASLARCGTLDAPTRAFLAAPPPSVSAGFAVRLIQVHFCIIYIAAGLSKLKGAAWWDGRATWDVLVNPEFTLLQYQWYESALRALVSIKPVYHALVAFGAWGTLFIEIAGPFLLWTRLRWLIVLLATAMHAAIGVLMGLNLFELLMMVMLAAFLPCGVIRDRLRGGPDAAKLALAFAPAHARAAALVAALDTENQVTLTPDPSAAAPTLTAAGAKHTGPDATAALFRAARLPALLSFLLWVPGVKGWATKRLFPAPAPR
ncbi:MAG: hypothetical protein FJ304_15745 [Planctomycetes bacterium]|nr:hypothetical protein [Planctomycetota bacterium]